MVTAVPEEVFVDGTADPEVVDVEDLVVVPAPRPDVDALLDDDDVELVAATEGVAPLAASVPVNPPIATRLATRVTSLARLAGCRRLRRLGALCETGTGGGGVRAPIGILVGRGRVVISDILLVGCPQSRPRSQGFP
jgi:hypothetical protein